MTERTLHLDETPYMAEAFAIKPELYTDIDRVYNSNKEVYRKAGKGSKFYKKADSASITISIYYKKVVDIFEYIRNKPDDYELNEALFNIAKKGYRDIHNFMDNRTTVKVSEIHKYISKKLDNLSTNEICANIAMFVFFSKFGVELEFDDRFMFEYFWEREKISTRGSLSLNEFRENDREVYDLAVKAAKRFPKKITAAITYEDIKDGFAASSFDFLYDLEGYDLFLLLDEPLNGKDVVEILCTYFEEDNEDKYDVESYFIAACHIKLLLKAYRKAQTLYNKNNKEQISTENKELKKEVKELKTENKHLQYLASQKPLATNADLEIKIREQQREIERLRAELDKANASKAEITALREFMFSQEQESSANSDTNNVILPDTGVIIVGGYSDWQDKLKQQYPKWKYIAAEQTATLSTSVLSNVNYLIFNTLRLSHKMYYKLIDIARSNPNIKIGYINNTNIDLNKIEIKKIIDKR